MKNVVDNKVNPFTLAKCSSATREEEKSDGTDTEYNTDDSNSPLIAEHEKETNMNDSNVTEGMSVDEPDDYWENNIDEDVQERNNNINDSGYTNQNNGKEIQDELRNRNLNNLLSEIAEQLGNSDLTDKIAIKF